MNETLEMFNILKSLAKPYNEFQPYCSGGWYQLRDDEIVYMHPDGGCFGLKSDGTWCGDLAPFCD